MYLQRPDLRRRSGASLAENALVLNITLLLLIGLIVAGLGIFRYQQVAAVAREGARYASVRGGQYAKETGQAAATAQTIYDQAILPKAIGLATNSLSHSVAWDDTSKMPMYFDYTNTVWKNNVVRVTVNYQWVPEAYLGGITLTSTSEMPVLY
jgi:Flp pilus assembly protein TadG